MATRTSIKNKNKAKLGAAASLAAGGVALSLDAGANSDPLGANGNALLESAFRLLEEGQNQFLAGEDAQTQDSKRFKPEIVAATSAADSDPGVQLLASADAMVSDVVMAQAPSADLVVAQSSTAAPAAPAPATAVETAVSTGAESTATTGSGASVGDTATTGGGTGSGTVGTATTSGASTAAGVAAAAETGAAAIVGFSPIAAALGVGATAVVVDAANSSGGSDLNNDQDITVVNDSPSLFSISGETVESNDVPVPATGAGLIGGTAFIDDSTNNFFS